MNDLETRDAGFGCWLCDAFRAHFEKYATAFPDFRLEINYMLLDGDRVAVHYTFLGTHAGQLAGYRPSGRTLRVPGMMISRIANRRIIEQYFLWDNGRVRQLAPAGTSDSSPFH